MFPRVGKQGNFEETSRVTNVSATMFPSLPWALREMLHQSYLGSEKQFANQIFSRINYGLTIQKLVNWVKSSIKQQVPDHSF